MISVIVPTFNRTECLLLMLQSINKQKNVEFEVLVIDQTPNVSLEKVSLILESCKNLHYYNVDKSGRSLSKNFAIDKAKGDIILFCDDDIIVEENFLEEHVKVHLENPNIGVLSCHLIEPHESELVCDMPLKITSYGRFINKPNAIYNGYVTSINGGNMSFKSSALEKIGYFDENLIGTSMLEEPDMAIRLMKNKYKLYFSSNSKVKHFPQHNGNINTRKGKHLSWISGYFFNQYYFMFRNQRKKYFPLILTYLVYRSVVEGLKSKSFSLKYLLIPFSTFFAAAKSWQRNYRSYKHPWHTPRVNSVSVIKYESN